MAKRLLLFFVCSMLLNTAFANQYVCPNTYQTVMTGFTSSQVLAACGQPTSQNSNNAQVANPVTVLEWVYTAPNIAQQNPVHPAPQLVVIFEDNRVAQIISNHDSSAPLFACHRFNRIKVGDTATSVRFQCGPPTFINMVSQASAKVSNVMQWTYNFGPYKPQIIFIFQDDHLVQIRMGQMGQ